MGKNYPVDLPEVGGILDAGNYLFRIESFKDDVATSAGKYQIKAELRVEEPTEHKGQPQFENFVIGTDDDLEADDPVTWKKSFAAGRYRQLLNAAGLAVTGNSDKDWPAAIGQRVGAIIQQEIQPPKNKDGSDNPYAGRVSSRVRQFFKPGEKEVGLAKPAAVKKPAAPPRPVTPVQE